MKWLSSAAFALPLALMLQAQPAVDHHLHLYRSMLSPPKELPVNAEQLIRHMDEANIRRGVILSVAYTFGNPFRAEVPNEYERVKEENDWTAQQASLYPDRLIVFCGLNPLKDYALAEIDRCAQHTGLRRGLKLHFGNSDVELDKPAHVAQIKRIFAAANRHRMAIIVHIRPNIDHGRPWNERQARIFLENILPEAKDIVVQIAHLTSAGRYDHEGVDKALGVFADAIAANDPRVKNLYFDLAIMSWKPKEETLQRQLRAIGMRKLLFGSDSLPAVGYKSFLQLPLTPEELKQIESNVARYWK